MAYEMKDGQGTMFQNADKQPEETNKPDWKGRIMVNGAMYWISGWYKNPNPDKGEFLSLSVQPMQDQPQAGPPAAGSGGRGAPPPRSGSRPVPPNSQRR